MKYRLSEGAGECFYYVGVEDGGYPRGLAANDLRLSLNNLNYMASSLKATAAVARLFGGAHGRVCALVQVRRNCVEDVKYVELRVAGTHFSCCTHFSAKLAIATDGPTLVHAVLGMLQTSLEIPSHTDSEHTCSGSVPLSWGYPQTRPGPCMHSPARSIPCSRKVRAGRRARGPSNSTYEV